jgi:hypothetical protein
MKAKKLMNIAFSGLLGFNFGFVTAMLLAQWTWLELRFNTGLFLLFGLAVGVILGCFREIKRPLIMLGISLTLIFATELVLAKGNVNSHFIITGYTFREGVMLPDLSLTEANLAFGIIIVLACVLAFIVHRKRKAEME